MERPYAVEAPGCRVQVVRERAYGLRHWLPNKTKVRPKPPKFLGKGVYRLSDGRSITITGNKANILQALVELRSADTLSRVPFPRWRLDQN